MVVGEIAACLLAAEVGLGGGGDPARLAGI